MSAVQRAAGLLLLLLSPAVAASPYSPSAYPHPRRDVKACGRDGVASSVCDPDLVLTKDTKVYLDGVLKAIWEGDPPYKVAGCGNKLLGYQVGVAVMRKMVVPTGSTPAEAAKAFARATHDKWGVGDPACNNGVLFLLSVDDRQVYISTGKGAQQALPDARIQSVIADIRPQLRKQDYDGAVKKAVVDIGLGLAGGKPKGLDIEWYVNWFGLAVLGVVGGCALVGKVLCSTEEWRASRKCKRMLAKLKREQENLRSHAWSCPQSCPICLEDFTVHPGGGGGGRTDKRNDDEATSSAAAGSSGLGKEAGPSTSLLGYNSEEEFHRMSAAGRAAVRRLRQRRKGASDGGASSSTSGGWAHVERPSPGPAGGTNQEGRQERAPVTLSCGHTFCEPCVEAWLDKGTTCPVCRRPISDGPTDSGDEAANRLADDWLATDLVFRLAQVDRRYPSYITPAMVNEYITPAIFDKWAEAQRAGSFTWGTSRDFALNNPGAQQHYQNSGGRGLGTTFAGGYDSDFAGRYDFDYGGGYDSDFGGGGCSDGGGGGGSW